VRNVIAVLAGGPPTPVTGWSLSIAAVPAAFGAIRASMRIRGRADLERESSDAFQVLIATMLSAQTRDVVTLEASTRLFRRARAPRTMAKLSTREIQRLIHPVSFYRH
jgi:endonuclease III